MPQVVQLKRSDKNYISGLKASIRKIDNEYKELAWLDKNIEFIRAGQFGALKSLLVVDGR